MKHQLKTYGGDTILLTDNQYQAIVEQYDRGATEFVVGSQRIPRSSISFLGFADGAAETMRVEEQNYKMTLSPDEAKRLKEKQYQDACMLNGQQVKRIMESTKTRVWKTISGEEAVKVELPERETRAIGMTNEESERGAAEYWIDENGQKMYS